MTEEIHAPGAIAESFYHRVFRTDFSEPGFALINLGPACGSESQRRLMIGLKNEFDRLERRHRGHELVYQSLTRFDQQVTTRPHRDGGPDESILMLGYEPSRIESHMELSDYSMCAYDLGLTPAEFLDQFNPMFPDGQNRLSGYTTLVETFDNTSFQILIINNSLKQIGDGIIGLLHTARIINPNREFSRIINSTMIASVVQGNGEDVSVDQQSDFVTTAVVRKPVYG